MRTRWLTMLLLAVFSLSARAQQPAPQSAKYDRIELAYEFLTAIYPELAGMDGRLTFQVSLYGRGTWGDSLFVHVQQCSNSTTERAVMRTRPPLPPVPPPPPRCGSPLVGIYGDFLRVSMHPYFSGRRIYMFAATGELVTSKLEPLQEEIEKHPEWKEDEMSEALRRRNPRLGPDHRDDFVKSIPVDTIYRFTGCRLDPGSAHMWVTRLGSPPDRPEIHIEWMVNGKSSLSAMRGLSCTAFFEPFEGRLIRLW